MGFFLVKLAVGFVAASYGMWRFERSRHNRQNGDEKPQADDGANTIVGKSKKAEESVIGTLADKLDSIRGIGPVYTQRLNHAGIQTFAQLAELTPDQVIEIVSPKKGGNGIDTQAWIYQAQQLVKNI